MLKGKTTNILGGVVKTVVCEVPCTELNSLSLYKNDGVSPFLSHKNKIYPLLP